MESLCSASICGRLCSGIELVELLSREAEESVFDLLDNQSASFKLMLSSLFEMELVSVGVERFKDLKSICGAPNDLKLQVFG